MPRHINGFVVPEGGTDIIGILRAQDSVEAMIEHADAWLNSFALTAQPKDNVAAAAEKLLDTNGALEIAPLASEAGLSTRQFQRSFTQQVGIAPKAYARLCRLSHAIYMHEQFPKLDWSEIAYGCGYSDQSHLAREFRELQNESPTQFRRYQWLSERESESVPAMSEISRPES
jgi:AraC-like DNA-binding protein